MKKFLMNLIPHTHQWSISKGEGDSESKFFIIRVCQQCGKIEHKDLRVGVVKGWVDGDYVPKKKLSDCEVEFVKPEMKKTPKGW